LARDVGSYLSHLGRQMRLDPQRRSEILKELRTHIEERVEELQKAGIPPEPALQQALQEMGNPAEVARGMYAVHTTGSWKDVILASMPHLLLSFLFGLHLWSRIIWLILLLSLATLVSLRTWRNGKPNWTYPWLGYALAAPAVSWVLALATLGYGGWMLFTRGTLPIGVPLYIGILVYMPFSLWFILRFATRLVRQDWLLLSLTALPLPFLASWFFFLHWRGGLLMANTQQVKETSSDAALVFLALGVTTAIFLKLGQRGSRILLLLVTAPILAALAGMAYQSNPQSLPVLFAAFATVAVLISPLLLEPWITPSGRWHSRLSFKLR